MTAAARLDALPLEELEEEVIFSEWRALRAVSSRSLQRTAALLEALGVDPQRSPAPILGVVGSKGKGTAAAYASAALAARGVRVGTVMSPGAVSNADRIRVDGQAADARARRRALLRIAEAVRGLPKPTASSGYLAPTGLFIVMAMLIFAEEQVEAVVAEAGIGGGSDDLSHWPLTAVVVTGIFAEHLDILGPTVADVARDKAAVIRPGTGLVVSLPQSAQVHQIVQEACTSAGARLLTASPQATALVAHLPAGYARDNAAAGLTAGFALPVPAAGATPAAAEAVVGSVHYPGRLSVHDAGSGGRVVVDSAVSADGLAGARRFAAAELDGLDQVLVCLPPSKDLDGFVHQLEDFSGPKVFVELPGAYIGVPDRGQWPDAPGWHWLRLEDLGESGVHAAPGSAQLAETLDRRRSLAVGTVLFTSLVLRTLRAEAGRLFVPPGQDVTAGGTRR
ncbi:hypothetical protein [Nesterenkonia sp.]|uniref:hypothetical protein n=1 Tax=Nesterenkonia sp. TaxID=704201 RepID=UPI00260BE36B|nr:hypothetical protein [Nesterenkonia sp.]